MGAAGGGGGGGSSSSSSPLLGSAAKFVTVSLIWGVTNVFIRRGACGVEKVRSEGGIARRFLSEYLYLFSKPSYVIPYLLNLCGSLLFYYALSDARLSVATPLTSSLVMVVTLVAGVVLGIMLVVAGAFLCVVGHLDEPPHTDGNGFVRPAPPVVDRGVNASIVADDSFDNVDIVRTRSILQFVESMNRTLDVNVDEFTL